jgi:hypothetical protein
LAYLIIAGVGLPEARIAALPFLGFSNIPAFSSEICGHHSTKCHPCLKPAFYISFLSIYSNIKKEPSRF